MLQDLLVIGSPEAIATVGAKELKVDVETLLISASRGTQCYFSIGNDTQEQ
jgi:hypothetical protein